MESGLKKRNVKKAKSEQDMFTSYVAELDTLVNKYPEDPNKTDLTEEKLNQLINDLDDNWIVFRKRWQDKLNFPEKIVGVGELRKSKKGIRHLIIKSEVTQKNVLDLTVADKQKKK